MNRNWPGAVSVALPSNVQALTGSARFVVDRTLKLAPGVFVKLNWNEPFARNLALVKMAGCASEGYNSALASHSALALQYAGLYNLKL